MGERILPERFRILSGSMLKVLAVVLMLIDHATFLMTQDVHLFTVLGHAVTVCKLIRLVTRMGFPLFAFLIAEGFVHTRSRVRYGVSLLVLALLSEIPWDLYFQGTVLEFGKQNVFFTLLWGYLGICAYEGLRSKPFLRVASVVVLLATALVLRSDYGITGVCFILLMYALRDHELLRDAIGTGVLATKWKAGLAFVPLAFYNGKRSFIKGPVLKYLFYLIYPLHLLALYCIRQYLLS